MLVVSAISTLTAMIVKKRPPARAPPLPLPSLAVGGREGEGREGEGKGRTSPLQILDPPLLYIFTKEYNFDAA